MCTALERSGVGKETSVVLAGVFLFSSMLEVKVSGSGTVESVTSTDIQADGSKEVDEVLVSEGETVTKGGDLITFTDGSDPIEAPAAGTITSLDVEEGDRVNDGQVVAHLTNYSDLQVKVQVDELDIPKVKVGQTAAIKINAFPEATYTGKVTSIAKEGTVSNGVSTFDVTVHIDKPTNVKIGMTAEVSILVEKKDNALYVPIEAVHTMNDEKFVLVVQQSADGSSTAVRQTVKTGISNEDNIEITDGLSEGQIVQLPSVSTSSSTNNPGRQERMMCSPWRVQTRISWKCKKKRFGWMNWSATLANSTARSLRTSRKR